MISKETLKFMMETTAQTQNIESEQYRTRYKINRLIWIGSALQHLLLYLMIVLHSYVWFVKILWISHNENMIWISVVSLNHLHHKDWWCLSVFQNWCFSIELKSCDMCNKKTNKFIEVRKQSGTAINSRKKNWFSFETLWI